MDDPLRFGQNLYLGFIHIVWDHSEQFKIIFNYLIEYKEQNAIHHLMSKYVLSFAAHPQVIEIISTLQAMKNGTHLPKRLRAIMWEEFKRWYKEDAVNSQQDASEAFEYIATWLDDCLQVSKFKMTIIF